MTVYIEAVIIDNFFVTALISVLSYRILSIKKSLLRIGAASCAGTAVAVIYPFLELHNALLVLIKLLLCILMSFMLFFKKGSIIKGGAVFLLTTFLFGGAMFCAGLMIHSDVDKALRLPLSDIPLGAIIGMVFLLYVVIRKAAGGIKRIRDANVYTAVVEIDIFSKTVKGTGFLDTGNRLYDFKSGLPVVVLGAKAALSVLDTERLKLVLEKKAETLDKSAHYIEYSAVGHKSVKMLVLKPDEIRLYSGKAEHRIKDVMIGLSFSKFSDAVDYDIILHPSIIKSLS